MFCRTESILWSSFFRKRIEFRSTLGCSTGNSQFFLAPYRPAGKCSMLPVMSDLPQISRSPELMSRSDSALLVVDVQEKLVAAIGAAARILWNVRRLIDGAKVLGLPVVASEQYPQGLGPTVPELASRLEQRPGQTQFQLPGIGGVVCGPPPAEHRKAAGLRHRNPRLHSANGARSAGRRLAGVRGRRCGGVAARPRSPDRPAADGIVGRRAHDDRGRAVRMVPGRRHGGVQADQPHRAGEVRQQRR